MSSKLHRYRVRLGIPSLSEAESLAVLSDLQEELDLRPHLDNPIVTWDPQSNCLIVEVGDEVVSAEQAAGGMTEELFEATCAVIPDTAVLRVEFLHVQPDPRSSLVRPFAQNVRRLDRYS